MSQSPVEIKATVSPTLETEKEGSMFQVEMQDVYEQEDSAIDPVYHAKARVLNAAFQEMGMGKYQWFLFVVTGFGWFSDNLWPVATTLILAPTVAEFGYKGPFIKLAWALGTLVGAAFWGIASDIWGRRWAFNITLFMTGIFATAAGGSPNAIALCSFVAVWSVGTGGNLPVDSAVFLEFIPASHQYLLTVLSIWWALGQLVGSLLSWPLIANFSCAGKTPETCPRSENMGWRYFMYTMGGIMLLFSFIRLFVFKLYESPRYLMSRGNDEKAVEIIRKVAKYNGTSTRLTVQMLKDAETKARGEEDIRFDVSAKAAVERQLRQVSMSHVKPLFATKKLALSTTLLILIWGLIGLAFPLYNGFVTIFFQERGTDFGDGSTYTTYRNLVILSVIGVPAAALAGWMVELPRVGRNGTLAISTILTGVFLFASTTAKTSNAFLGWNCGYTFTSNIMYGVLYGVSPELFPTKDRGTGNTLVALSNRIFGIAAPVIALYSNLTTSVPIWIAAALFISAGLLALLLPFDPRGKASL